MIKTVKIEGIEGDVTVVMDLKPTSESELRAFKLEIRVAETHLFNHPEDIKDLTREISTLFEECHQHKNVPTVYVPTVADLSEYDNQWFDVYYETSEMMGGEEKYVTDDGEVGKNIFHWDSESEHHLVMQFDSLWVLNEDFQVTSIWHYANNAVLTWLIEGLMAEFAPTEATA